MWLFPFLQLLNKRFHHICFSGSLARFPGILLGNYYSTRLLNLHRIYTPQCFNLIISNFFKTNRVPNS